MSATLTPNAPAHDLDRSHSDETSQPLGFEHAVEEATSRVAPLWPLESFVAVNPFMGLSKLNLADAADLLGKTAGARLTPPRRAYLQSLSAGTLQLDDLRQALQEAPPQSGAPQDVEALLAHVKATPEPAAAHPLPTVADAAAAGVPNDWANVAVCQVSDWASGYFDRGQALWGSPWRHLPPYAAWRAEASLDRSPELQGVTGFRHHVETLPDSADELFERAAEQLGLPSDALTLYFHRLLMGLPGWAGYARQQVWQSELQGRNDTTLRELLAIRVAWELVLLRAFKSRGVRSAWHQARTAYVQVARSNGGNVEAWVDGVLQAAQEKAWQRRMRAALAQAPGQAPAARPQVQAVFCIDVRSEVYRRALEAAAPGCATLGFAGFFGFPIAYSRLGEAHASAQCPALIAPRFSIKETSSDATLERRKLRRLAATDSWAAFKKGAVSSFGFVETMGLSYLWQLVSDGLGLSRPLPSPSHAGLSPHERETLQPDLDLAIAAGSPVGMRHQDRVGTAEAALRGMSLTRNFARLVLLAGHGSQSANNPHAAGLDCGACGGHSGEANARVAVAVLNDPRVREDLRARGIDIPEDTVFVAGLHDTTTDDLRICDPAQVPASHQPDLAQLRTWLSEAGQRCRAERAPGLGVPAGAEVDAAVRGRARDWSQVRPEWGLAGCVSFIVAPRERTRGIDLGGRSFLHSYDWREDDGFGVLEAIMTAPMVVTSWINLQYYASSVDNRTFGCGNKTLHNVVGQLGVLEGSGGDLRPGLAMQSVHDGTRLVHDPLRLSVYIEAPVSAMTDVLTKHESLRELVDNGWLHLMALSDGGEVTHRYVGDLTWVPVSEAACWMRPHPRRPRHP